MQDQPPGQPGQLDHPRIPEKFGQVTPYRRRRRRFRRPQIDQQDGRSDYGCRRLHHCEDKALDNKRAVISTMEIMRS